MSNWKPKFVEPDVPLTEARQILYREHTVWRSEQNGRMYQYFCMERTPPGDFFVALCVAWKESIFRLLMPEDVLSMLRHRMFQFTRVGGTTYPTLETAIAAFDLTQAEKG